MKRNISQERRELIENAVGNISDRFIREVYEENNKTTASGKHRAAPAWARPLAASVCAILAVGLLILSIPVVNNIITNRGTGALPTDTPEVEQTAAFENDPGIKSPNTPEQTKAPEETEKVEVSRLDKKITAVCKNILRNKTASFNDLFNDEHRFLVAAAADAKKIEVGMTIEDIVKILGVEGSTISTGALYRFALDDGRVLKLTYHRLSMKEMYVDFGMWDPESGDFSSDNLIEIDDFDEKFSDYMLHIQVEGIEFLETESSWDSVIRAEIIKQVKFYYSQGLVPSWDKE